MSQPDLQEWNLQTITLMQALIGAISANFRMVTLDWSEDTWIISIYLERDDPQDREEAEDVGFEFDALQLRNMKSAIKTYISPENPIFPKPPTRVVFKRREYFKDEVE
ncbi:hypothetical protein [Nitrospirillum viridazoti]|uniref:Uncharacterized protein n=1 Tax=Nitrospirillum amazonense TaxID=28077 RepID=A0A560IPZ5_9PROT|nr:hypothetical protein [Nitrospirillum amazonense]TWB60511.1 hypothetical protein FBZ92_10672 [Nitrospirillum amazonense]